MSTSAPNLVLIDQSNFQSMRQIIEKLSLHGGGIVYLSSSMPKGVQYDQCPPNVRIIDSRYGGLSILNQKHPRQEGIWTQYSHLSTGLAKNIVISDTITNNTEIESWQSSPHAMQLAPYGAPLSSEEYRHQHNHYQNLLCETFNFSSDLNAVSIWGDSGAFVPGAKSWGAFFSARSWPVKWNGYTPSYAFSYEEHDFDAALVGIEVDVLNNGLDWGAKSSLLTSPMAKVGVQIVGFGKRNTAAIEIRTEDSDDPANTPHTRRGAWQWGIIARNCLHENSTLLYSENAHIRRGIDFEKTTFEDGALVISGRGPKSGIVFDNSDSGEVFSDGKGDMTVKIGSGSLSIILSDSEQISIGSDLSITITPGLKSALKRALGLP